jgi:hypothetical protein
MNVKRSIRGILVAELVLLVPLIAMQFTTEVDWDLRDFVIVGFLLAGIGMAFQQFVTGIKNSPGQAVMGIVLALAMLLIWIELAVGVFGSPFAGS